MSLRDWQHLEDMKQGIIDGNIIADIWMIDDVMNQTECDEATAKDVLEFIKNSHDACIGINWDVIDCAYFEILAEESTP